VTRRPTPGQSEALAVFAQQLEGIKHQFADVDRRNERFALYGVDTPQHGSTSISIDEWGTLLGAVKARLRLAVGATQTPGFNDTLQALQATVLGCVDALDQLQAMLGDALSLQPEATWRDTVSAAERRADAPSHVSGVPVSIARLEGVELLALELFEIEQRVVRALRGPDQLVELDLDRFGVPVLRVLNQKHHQKGDDRRAGVDDQLPGVAEAEKRAGDDPDRDHCHSKHEDPRPAAKVGCGFGEVRVAAAGATDLRHAALCGYWVGAEAAADAGAAGATPTSRVTSSR
jgi:hypothetical protein